MNALESANRRLPLLVFVLVLILAVLLFGFGCALMSDHPGQFIDRASSAVAALPAIVEAWSFHAAAAAACFLIIAQHAPPLRARASPAALQRFLL